MNVVIDRGNGYFEVEDSANLEYRCGIVENDNEFTQWWGFWEQGKCVKRSAHIHFKKGLALFGEQGVIGG